MHDFQSRFVFIIIRICTVSPSTPKRQRCLSSAISSSRFLLHKKSVTWLLHDCWGLPLVWCPLVNLLWSTTYVSNNNTMIPGVSPHWRQVLARRLSTKLRDGLRIIGVGYDESTSRCRHYRPKLPIKFKSYPNSWQCWVRIHPIKWSKIPPSPSIE